MNCLGPEFGSLVLTLHPFCSFVQVGVLLSYAIWAVSYSFPVFILSRMLAGSSKGIVSLSTAIISDVTDIGHRSKGMVGLRERGAERA